MTLARLSNTTTASPMPGAGGACDDSSARSKRMCLLELQQLFRPVRGISVPSIASPLSPTRPTSSFSDSSITRSLSTSANELATLFPELVGHATYEAVSLIGGGAYAQVWYVPSSSVKPPRIRRSPFAAYSLLHTAPHATSSRVRWWPSSVSRVSFVIRVRLLARSVRCSYCATFETRLMYVTSACWSLLLLLLLFGSLLTLRVHRLSSCSISSIPRI